MITVLKDEQFRKALLVAFREARREILITTFKCNYRATLASRNLNPLILELKKASERLVKVKMIIHSGDARSSLARSNEKARAMIYKEGIQIKAAPPGRTFHAKFIVVDEKTAWVGSHNLSETSLCQNFEVSVVTDDTGTIEQLREIFLDHWYR